MAAAPSGSPTAAGRRCIDWIPTASLKALGFQATNGGNAPPSPVTRLAHDKGSDAAASRVAGVLRTGGERVARAPQAGLARSSVVLVLGKDFKGLASRVPKTATRPPKPTAATRDLPAWDPRPC